MTPPPPPNAEMTATRVLIERAIILGLLGALVVGVVHLLLPFTTALLFGGTLAIAGWPLRRQMTQRGLKGGSAATVLLVASLLLILIPVLAILPSLTEQVGKGMQIAQDYTATSPAAPAFFKRVPVIGAQLTAGWNKVVDAQGDFRTLIAPYAAPIRGFILTAAQALADSVVQLLLSLIVATVFWARGDTLAAGLQDILGRLAGPAATRAVEVAAGAVRGVAYGVIGTAALQAGLLTFGLLLAGVPASALLGFITLLLLISQIGAMLVPIIWGGAAWWLFDGGATGWAIFMIVCGVFVGTIDNFVRPWLISFGVDMPMILVILGVFGGFMSFGFLGLFIGPSLLSVMYTLLQSWRAASATNENGGEA